MADMFVQAGVIPYRIVDGVLDILLISTSSGKHLTIPKGLIDPGFSATDTALNEAWEEAGIEGELLTAPVGSYRFSKWGGICEASVFIMAVTRVLDQWPEAGIRRRLWTDCEQAATRVKHRDLGELILKVPTVIRGMRDEG